MAGETDSFTLEMKDAISGPAGDASKALKKLKSDAGGMSDTHVDKDLAKASKGMKDSAKDSSALGKDILGLAGNFGTLGAIVGASAGGTVAVVQELISVVKSAAVTIVGWLEQGAELAIEGQQFARHMKDVFQVFRGTAEKGQQTLDVVRAMGSRVPITQKEAADTAQELLSLGIKGQNRLGNTIQAIGQLQGVEGDKAAAKLKGIIGTAQSSTQGGIWRGVFAPSRQDLQEIGLSYDDLSKALAKDLGKTQAETKRMLMYGQISAQQGIDAINEAISGGAIGKAAQDALLDPALLFKQFKENISNMFTIDSPEAKEFMKEVRGFVLSLAPGSENAKTMGDSIKALVREGFKKGSELIQDFEHDLTMAEIAVLNTDTALAPLKKSLERLGENQSAIEGVDAALWQMGVAADIAYYEVLGLAGQFGAILDIFSDIDDMRNLDFSGISSDIINGLVEGVKSQTGLFGGAMADLGGEGLKQLKHALGIASPSKEAAKIGVNVGEGFQEGAASEGLGLGETKLRSPDVGSLGGGGGISVQIDLGGLHVGAGVRDAPEMMRLLEPALKSLAERLSEELGGATGAT